MFDHRNYVPIIRWKQGERIALRELFPEDKIRITPLIQFTPDVAAKYSGRPANASVAVLLSEIKDDWGNAPAFIDLDEIASTNWFGPDAIKRLFMESAYRGLDLTPVATLDPEAWHQNAMRKAVADSKRGICLRLFRKDFQSPAVDRKINSFLSFMNLNTPFVDLVVDLQTVTEADALHYSDIFTRIPLLQGWRTFTIIGGAFPKDLTGFSVGEYLLPRAEWTLWKDFQQKSLSRKATFGDYATLHPILSTPFPGMNVSASIRYTSHDHWLIMRGEGLRNEDGARFAQYPANAQLLMLREEFCGRDFSYGNRYIFERPFHPDKPGSPRTWLTMGVNHHLTFVVRQIAELYGVQIDHRQQGYLDIGLTPESVDYISVHEPSASLLRQSVRRRDRRQ